MPSDLVPTRRTVPLNGESQLTTVTTEGTSLQAVHNHELVAGDSDKELAIREAALLKDIQEASDANVNQAAEIQYSRCAIIQPQSPEITRSEQGYTAGMLVNNITREPLSVECLPPWLLARKIPAAELKAVHCSLFVPVFKLPSEFIEWKDVNTEGNGWHFKTLNENDPRVRAGTWGSRGVWKPTDDQKSPPVTENINFFGLFLHPESYEPMGSFMVATFAKTGFKTGQKLVTAVQNHKMHNLPPWGITYYIYTKRVDREKPRATWYEPKCAAGPRLSTLATQRLMHQQILETAASFARKDTVEGPDGKPAKLGRMLQERVINAAFLDNADSGNGGGDGDGGSDDANDASSNSIPF